MNTKKIIFAFMIYTILMLSFAFTIKAEGTNKRISSKNQCKQIGISKIKNQKFKIKKEVKKIIKFTNPRYVSSAKFC